MVISCAAPFWQLWGKADPARAGGGGPDWHPLLCHVIDVVACAERLLVGVRADRLVVLASSIGLAPEAALPWLLFFIALHDMGKATPPFQGKVEARRAALVGLGLDFPQGNEPHGNLSVPLATTVLVRRGVPASLARWVARTVGAHHGEFIGLEPLSKGIEKRKGVLQDRHAGKAGLWEKLREDLVEALAEACGVTPELARPSTPPTDEARNAFVADLAGLTTVTDWLGSNADVFQYVDPPASALDYLDLARKRAEEAVAAAGWRRPPLPGSRTFFELFGKRPWPLHEAMEALVPTLEAPALVIVEAPMGEGKTEAALSAFDALAARGATGLYFALPTQATSNQIFGRVTRFLQTAFAGETHGIHLVHGDAGLSEAYEALRNKAFALRSVGDVSRSKDDQGPIADGWFARGKRALLAPIAVGTVDQALLGVLGVRHGFLRLHGLAGKVVVIDEVHAYDTYTSKLLDTLLAWLRALGASVVLLSATLPSARRDALIRAFGAEPAQHVEYPRITFATGGRSSTRPVRLRRPPVPVSITWHERTTLPDRLAETLSDGGCAVWIVNTVRRAQQTYRRLRRLQERGRFPADLTIDLLHARFPFDARAEREKRAEAWFGPGETSRPRAAILVGTQVLEQSLDLDFDLMVTDLAPVDLVLQRAGRLHRHARKNSRPPRVARPALWLVRPEDEQNPAGPSFGSSSFVYSEAVLLRSWLALRERSEVHLPTDIEALIEAVYTGTPPGAAEVLRRLAALDAAHREQSTAHENQARSIVLPPPSSDDPFGQLSRALEDEDPKTHRELRAATRLGDPTVEVVPVTERGGRTVLAGRPDVVVDLDASEPPPRSTVVAIARQSLGLARRDVVASLLNEPVPRAFQASGHLRFHRVLRLDGDGRTTVAGVPLHLDSELGLVVGSLDEHDSTALETSA